MRALVLAIAPLGCRSGQPAPRTRVPQPTVEASGASVPAGLSAQGLAALHELGGGTAPAPRGRSIDLAGGRAYLSLPEGAAAPLPGVVVVHEWWGLNDHVRHWADRLAAEGYAALAVDLYAGKSTDKAEEAVELMKSVDAEAARRILVAAHEFLAADERVRAPRRAVIGWCFGGSMALQLALSAPDLDACVLFYGRPVTEAAQLAKIRARVLGVFGTRDPSIPGESVDAFEGALERAGVRHRILRYDAEHAFANPWSARYDPAAAEDAWARARDFLAAALR